MSGWSVDWNKFTTPEECLIRSGLTYKFNKNEFRNQNDYRIFELNVGQVKKIEEITRLEHTPTNRTPEKIGQPNNPSHSSLYYMDVEVRMELLGIIKEILKVDRDAVDAAIGEAKKGIQEPSTLPVSDSA
ncbi:hypothetical protein [Pedobacter hiemivivus]|uniref:Uncharacterized protein n=1 Tax=Pedobacter hiemivivus TaxID=2530454 RepID=A0A4R0NDL8_9SPHI|nr:hypothetical protein [Pedobacter hiemivivus]TCC98489.1 hypothetical protein EZ444_04185 [Pedobacter hiemivivus]